MRTLECQIAIERIIAYTQDADAQLADIDRAIVHMERCPYCQGRVGHLIRALASAERDRLSCADCEERLPEYVQAVQDRRGGMARWHPVVRHLEQCGHCSEAYADLAELAALAQGDQVLEPPAYPRPNLAFLRKEQAGRPWHLDALGRLVIAFSAELLSAPQGPLPPAYATARHKAGPAAPVLYEFALTEGVADLEVTITAEQARDDPAQCTIVVAVTIPSRGGWPNLGGSAVALRSGDLELAAQPTDAFGKAIFARVAVADLPELVFTIAPVASAG